MSESALDRTARALDLIPFIHANPGWTVNELAEKFHSSPAQIFKDLEMLFMCGLPGYSHLELIDLELDEDFVAIRNPQNLTHPRKFSYSEVVSLAVGLENLISIVSEESLREQIGILRDKLAAFLGNRDPVVALLDKKEHSQISQSIEMAISHHQKVEIEYFSNRTESITKRVIIPIRTYEERSHTYTEAFCEMNHEVRHFRNDRISNIEILSEESHLSEIASDRAQQRSGKAQMVVIRSSKQNRFFFEENSEIVNRINEERDSLFVEFSIENTDWLLKAFCSLPGKVEIIEPTQMKTAFDERLDAILALYR